MRAIFVPCVYILASKAYGTLYAGVTSDLWQRMPQHIDGVFEGFTKRYGVTKLVYYELHDDMTIAIEREKRLKRWKRAWKIRLIEQMNPEWLDLYDRKTGSVFDAPHDAQGINKEIAIEFERTATRHLKSRIKT